MLRSAAARAVAAAAGRPRASAPAWSRGLATAGDGGPTDGEDAPTPPPPPAATDDTASPPEAGAEWRSWADSRLAALSPDAAPAEPAASRPPPRATVVQPPTSALPSPFTGYAELGGVAPTAGSQTPHPTTPPHPAGRFAAQRWAAAAGRVHPGRLFYPGQSYKPADLVAGAGAADPAAAAVRPRGLTFRRPTLPPAPEIRAKADFRDARFLASLLTDTGRLPPRRRTRLTQAAHRHVMRQVKLARQMALLHPLTKHARADGGGGQGGGGGAKEDDESEDEVAAAET